MSRWKKAVALWRNPLVLSFYLPSFLLSFGTGMMIPVLPLYAADFEIAYGLIGLVLAAESLGTWLGDVPAGMILRRLGDKRNMMVGIGLLGLSVVALFWTTTVGQVLLLRLLAGFGNAMYGVSRHAFVAGKVSVGNRGKAISLLGGLARIGKFGGPAVGGLIASQVSLPATFLLYGVVAGFAFLCVAALLPDGRATAVLGAGAHTRSRHNLWQVLKHHYGVLAAAGTGQLFAQMIRAGRDAIIPLFAADVLGLDVQTIGFIVSLSSAVDMSLFIPAGIIMDRYGRKYAIVPSFSIQMLGMALVPFAGSAAGLALAACTIGFGNGLSSGAMMTLGADLAPTETRGEFLGVWRLIGDTGTSVGPLAVGGVAQLLALASAAWAIASAGLLAALIFAFLVPETLQKQGQGSGARQQPAD